MGESVVAPPVHRARADTTASHHQAVRRVIAAMRERLDEELSLHEMADVAIMSPFHFNRTFHQVIGLPPGRFLSALRLERARRLLLTTQERVTDVCFDVGYNSLGTFTRRFTEVLGVSPRELRGFASVAPPPAVPLPPAPRPAARRSGFDVHGTVDTPRDFAGVVFVGLFASAVPQGVPVVCRVLAGAGAFSLSAPAGRFHVYALAVQHVADPLGLLMFDEALRASGGTIDVPSGAPEPLHLTLRPREEFDPPILLTLPLLLARRSAAARARRAARREAVA